LLTVAAAGGRYPGTPTDQLLVELLMVMKESSSSSSLLNYIQKFTIIEDRLNLLERFNVSAINKGTLLNNVGRLGTSVFT
jgi:hypothetical protein